MQAIAVAVRHHHERWDGTGYPDGLCRKEIPLASSIIAVCDAWDAMTSERPYRRRLAEQEALERIISGAGSQFDPAITEAFVSLAGDARERGYTHDLH